MAGQNILARHFPFSIGRGASSSLRLDEPGLWEEHLEIAVGPDHVFVLNIRPNALVTVNQQPFAAGAVRNGDVIEMGGLKIRFGFPATTQQSLRLREWLTWIGLALLSGGQVVLIYRMLH